MPPDHRQTGFGNERRRSADFRSGPDGPPRLAPYESYRPGAEYSKPSPKPGHVLPPKSDGGHTASSRGSLPSRISTESRQEHPSRRDVEQTAPLTIDTGVTGPNSGYSSPASGYPETSTPRMTAPSNQNVNDKKPGGRTEAEWNLFKTLEDWSHQIFKKWELAESTLKLEQQKDRYQEQCMLTARSADTFPSLAEAHRQAREQLEKTKDDLKKNGKTRDVARERRNQVVRELVKQIISVTGGINNGKNAAKSITDGAVSSENHDLSQIEKRLSAQEKAFNELSAQEDPVQEQLSKLREDLEKSFTTELDKRLSAQQAAFNDQLSAQKTAFEKQLSAQQNKFDNQFTIVNQQSSEQNGRLDTYSKSLETLSTEQGNSKKEFEAYQKQTDQQLSTVRGEVSKSLGPNKMVESLREGCIEVSKKMGQISETCNVLQNDYESLKEAQAKQESTQVKIKTDHTQIKAEHSDLRNIHKQLKDNYEELKKDKKGGNAQIQRDFMLLKSETERHNRATDENIRDVKSRIEEVSKLQGQMPDFAKHQHVLKTTISEILPNTEEFKSLERRVAKITPDIPVPQQTTQNSPGEQSNLRDTVSKLQQQVKDWNMDCTRVNQIKEWWIDDRPRHSLHRLEKALSTVMHDLKSLQTQQAENSSHNANSQATEASKAAALVKSELEQPLKHVHKKIEEDSEKTINHVTKTMELITQALEEAINNGKAESKEGLSQLGNRFTQLENRFTQLESKSGRGQDAEQERRLRSLEVENLPQKLQGVTDYLHKMSKRLEGVDARFESIAIIHRSINSQLSNVQTKGIASDVIQQTNPYNQQTVQHLMQLQRDVEKLPGLIQDYKRLKEQVGKQESILGQFSEAKGHKRSAEPHNDGGATKWRIVEANGHARRSPSIRNGNGHPSMPDLRL